MDECNSIEPDNCAVHGWGASAPEVGLTEVERLADVLYRDRQTRTVPDTVPEALDARAILASDWLAERDARIKADAIAQERAAWVAKIEALAKDWQRTSDEFAEGNGGWNKVMRYKDAAATLRALLPSDATEEK